jgi:SAM-dependent methyltransferase
VSSVAADPPGAGEPADGPHARHPDGWRSPVQALSYLARADAVPHRAAGEAELVAELPVRCERVLDLGCGDGRLLALVRQARPGVEGVAVDYSPPMLEAARERFAAEIADGWVTVAEHDLTDSMDGLRAADGPFDAVISSFAIHHLDHGPKRALYAEVFERLRPGGLFANLEHVSSASIRLHEAFMDAMGQQEDDPENRLLDLQTQLESLRELGFADVDCLWKWRELALLVGVRPEA